MTGMTQGLIKPLVFGGIDGLTTTLAIVWGSIAAGEELVSSYAVIVLGVANLLATATSMGVGDYAGTLAEYEAHLVRREEEDNDFCPSSDEWNKAREQALKDVRMGAMRSGLTMFFSFIFFGGVPLLAYAPYFGSAARRRVASSVLCAVSFFVLGAVRSRMEGGRRASVCRSSLSMMAMGGLAVLVSFAGSKTIYWLLGIGDADPPRAG